MNMNMNMNNISLQCASALFLLSCTGSGAEQVLTAQEQILAIEKSGQLPKLDRDPTLLGIDVNQNGVRDDIEEIINRRFESSEKRAAAMQLAIALQKSLVVDSMSRIAAKAAGNEIHRG
ncbi:MAG: hypothetical protein EXR35_08550 [Limnohabitans sp.]|nr:hypothetical protein [Limnohabitans sp.]